MQQAAQWAKLRVCLQCMPIGTNNINECFDDEQIGLVDACKRCWILSWYMNPDSNMIVHATV